MKAAVILTGGTIGSKIQENGWISPEGETPYEIIKQFQKQYPIQAAGVEFDCFMPYKILSENLNGAYVELLIDQIQKCLAEERYEGILICHGTDTLQYTAAILDYVFANTDTPILLVSSNYPLEDSRANGLINFYYALQTLSKEVTGAAVVYQNSDGRTYVHRGTRLLAHQTFEDDLYSIRHSYVGVYDKNGNWTFAGDGKRTDLVPYKGLLQQTDAICWIRAYPGLPYPELRPETKAVILESYHSGTIGVDEALRAFAAKAKVLQIPVYLVGAVSDKEGYETIKHYQEIGIQVLAKEAPIAVYCRLWLELGRGLPLPQET